MMHRELPATFLLLLCLWTVANSEICSGGVCAANEAKQLDSMDNSVFGESQDLHLMQKSAIEKRAQALQDSTDSTMDTTVQRKGQDTTTEVSKIVDTVTAQDDAEEDTSKQKAKNVAKDKANPKKAVKTMSKEKGEKASKDKLQEVKKAVSDKSVDDVEKEAKDESAKDVKKKAKDKSKEKGEKASKDKLQEVKKAVSDKSEEDVDKEAKDESAKDVKKEAKDKFKEIEKDAKDQLKEILSKDESAKYVKKEAKDVEKDAKDAKKEAKYESAKDVKKEAKDVEKDAKDAKKEAKDESAKDVKKDAKDQLNAKEQPWELLGDGCCADDRDEANGKLLGDNVTSEEDCKALCRAQKNCGIVEYGWKDMPQWCFAWADTQKCTKRDTDCKKSIPGNGKGVKGYRFKMPKVDVNAGTWYNLGDGCCEGKRDMRNGKLYGDMEKSLDACKARCLAYDNCGVVEYGWQLEGQTEWCYIWSSSQKCLNQDRNCSKSVSRNGTGVKAYLYKQ